MVASLSSRCHTEVSAEIRLVRVLCPLQMTQISTQGPVLEPSVAVDLILRNERSC